MSDPDKFLSRWSRRKAAAADQDVPPSAAPEFEAKADQTNVQTAQSAAAPAAQERAPSPEFDPSTLPSIESIVAGTDVSAFLKAGVPADLTRAALRRAWAADPKIRDFIGLSENSWDFTAPGGVPGFGPLSAEEVSELMAQFASATKDIAGKAMEAIDRVGQLGSPDEPAKAGLPPRAPDNPPPARADAGKQPASPAQDQSEQNAATIDDGSNSLQRGKENIATQHNAVESNDARPTRRAHGRALPD